MKITSKVYSYVKPPRGIWLSFLLIPSHTKELVLSLTAYESYIWALTTEMIDKHFKEKISNALGNEIDLAIKK
jgi:hypothetical protein